MKVITVATLKGGNAKTTTCLGVAAVLAEKGHSVVLVDADPQSTATMIFMGCRADRAVSEGASIRLDHADPGRSPASARGREPA
jgi:chromosome partitioning protein